MADEAGVGLAGFILGVREIDEGRGWRRVNRQLRAYGYPLILRFCTRIFRVFVVLKRQESESHMVFFLST
jgi:hypothetical protein